MGLEWFLTAPTGWRRRIPVSGLLVGRASGCDVVLTSRSVSRQHALLRLTLDGPEIVPLGSNPVLVGGRPLDRKTVVEVGADIQFGEVRFTLVEDPGPTPAPWVWQLVVADGESHGVLRTPMSIGGGAADDLILAEWVPGAVILHLLGDGLVAEAGPAIEIAGADSDSGFSTLEHGSVITANGRSVTVVQERLGDGEHTLRNSEPGASRVALRFRERGGEVEIDWQSRVARFFLPDLQFDLLAALLQPPATPGQFVDDTVVFSRIWGAGATFDRKQLNLLIHRARKSLLAAGLDGKELIARAPAGGETRFVVTPGATVAPPES